MQCSQLCVLHTQQIAASLRRPRKLQCHALPAPWQVQALRLFVHYPFLVRAAHYSRATEGGQQGSNDGGDWLGNETLKACLRGQTFFSVGLRGLYAFIPLVGGWVLVGCGGVAGCRQGAVGCWQVVPAPIFAAEHPCPGVV